MRRYMIRSGTCAGVASEAVSKEGDGNQSISTYEVLFVAFFLTDPCEDVLVSNEALTDKGALWKTKLAVKYSCTECMTLEIIEPSSFFTYILPKWMTLSTTSRQLQRRSSRYTLRCSTYTAVPCKKWHSILVLV